MTSSVDDRPFWSLHTHSKFSVNDALPTPEQCVEKAVELGYPALGLTDHGSPVRQHRYLQSGCRKVGIEPLPGIELYVVHRHRVRRPQDNMHLTIAAYTEPATATWSRWRP